MGAKTDAIVKLVFVFFVSLLSFSIGIFAGKKYSDNQHQLAMLEPGKATAHDEMATHGNEDAAHREIASTEGHSPSGEPALTGGEAMSDEEIAKLAEEFVADDTAFPAQASNHKKDEPSHEPAKTAEAPAPQAPAPSHSPTKATSPSAKVIPPPAAPSMPVEHAAEKHVADKPESRIPTSLPKDVGSFKPGKFTVQVASYGSEKEAAGLATELKGKGYSAFYVPAEVKGKVWYRVSVGQFNTMKEAQSYRTELLEKAHVTTAIVQKITQ